MLKNLQKVTNQPTIQIGIDKSGKWKIVKPSGKLDNATYLSEWEAKEAAINMASSDLYQRKDWKKYKEKHSHILNTYLYNTLEFV